MSVRKSVTLPAGARAGLVVTVRELTVSEVRDWATESATLYYRDPIHALALDGIGLDELARMTDVPPEALEPYAPSELAELLSVAKALNPHFFRFRSALQWVAGHSPQPAPKPSPETSTAPSADSSASMDTQPS